MDKVIFGSGIVGLLAKEILGNDWKIVPFGRSLFYSFHPALDDNFIVRDERVDDVISYFNGKPIYIYKIRYSRSGEICEYSKDTCELWAAKLFGQDIPAHFVSYMLQRQNFIVYDLCANLLYEKLCNKYESELLQNHRLGKVERIGHNFYQINGQKYHFDKAISTIPLDALLKYIGIKNDLKYKQSWYIHLQTKNLDFENNNQLLVADDNIDFYKVTALRDNRYILCFNRNIELPGQYLSLFMNKFDIIDGTTIEKSIPVGEIPKIQELENMGIHCIGKLAQWDYCMDVGSCILRILNYKRDQD